MTGSPQARICISRARPRTASRMPYFALALVLTFVVLQRSEASSFRVVYSFKGQPDGYAPQGTLVKDGAGNLYGTTTWGGSVDCTVSGQEVGCGTIFKVDKKGNETVLYDFGQQGGDGVMPVAGLVRDVAGNLYGTTTEGGVGDCGGYGCGTVFKLDTTGHETVLHSFAGGSDGGNPEGVILDAYSNLYGTTAVGGSSCDCGTVFKLDATGHETVLYSFSGTDGEFPYAGLARDTKGNLYGTTLEGGAFGWGTVFKLTPKGKETLLYSFRGGKDGANPTSSVKLDGKGNLYGTTQHGGAPTCNGGNGCGVVFRLDARGQETVLHTFCLKNCQDGKDPSAGLILGTTGNFYSTTFEGGITGCDANNGCGTVFEISRAGKEAVLHRFTSKDGAYPLAGLVVDGTGRFYGTTAGGAESGCIGYFGCGDLFEIVP
jgi:uncharacterized repeat protein (TIGR03803 family)